jgi:2-polyprenyl-3-methyl-5-hydroxy-6-metoxy-1,4-benzoquinol methylase
MKAFSRTEVQNMVVAANAIVAEHQQDEMAIPSYTHFNPLIRWLMWQRYRAIEQLAELSSVKSVLEFGCGIGLFLPTLNNAGCDVYAVDLFPQYAKSLVSRLNLDVIFIDSIDSVSDNHLDLIVAADVLEHVNDLPGYVRAFHRKLRRGGAVLVSGPTENFAYRIGRVIAGFSGKADYHHTNIDRIKTVFEGNGFETKRAKFLPASVPPHLFKVYRFEAD